MGVAASRADAFLGEGGVVVPGSPPTLTPGAEDVLKNPKTIPEIITQGKSFGGTAEANGAARVFQAGRIFPALGTAVAGFTAGWEIGTEICGVLGIGGCFHIFGEPGTSGPSPAVSGGYPNAGSWQFKETEFIEGVPSYNFIWKFGTGSGAYEAIVTGHSGECKGWTGPGDASYWLTRPTGAACLKAGGGETYGQNVTAVRLAMEGLQVEYNSTDDPAVPNTSYTAPSNWADETAKALQAGTPEADRVGEYVASEIPGSGVPNPYPLTVEVPNCDGLVYAACEELLEERGLNVTRVTRTWETADTDAEPDEVLELNPAKATEVEKATTVTVTTNPNKAGMPIVIPEPGARETYDEYASKLNPGLTPERIDLTEAYIDPARGPGEVVSTSPSPGTRVNPSTGGEVTVRTNPAEAPAPGTSAWAPPAIPALDLSPLASVAVGCNTFPFGIFCWLQDGLSGWASSGTCPEIDVPLGTSVEAGSELPFDLCQFEPAMEIIRPILVVVSTLCLGMMFAYAALGIGGSGGGED